MTTLSIGTLIGQVVGLLLIVAALVVILKMIRFVAVAWIRGSASPTKDAGADREGRPDRPR